MAPPKLARDTPVAHVLHPVAVHVFKLGRYQADVIVHHMLIGRLGEFFHLDKPLGRELGLDYRIGALRETHVVGIVFHLYQMTSRLQFLHYFLAHHKAVFTHKQLTGLIDGAVIVKDINGRQVMLLPQLVVVDVVGRGNLQTAGTEVHGYVLIQDNGHLAVDQRYDGRFAMQVLVALIVRVDAHGRIAQDGLRPGGGDGYSGVFARHRVGHVVEFGLHLFIDHLIVRQGGFALRIPVDHAHPAVYMALAVEINKHLDHRLGKVGVHGKARTLPVARSAQLFELLQNNTPVFLFPLPGILQKLLTAEVVLVDAFLAQHGHYFGLGGYGGVVGARHPAGLLALHARPADEHILDGVVEHMPHVQHPGNVRGWYYDGIGLFVGVGLGMKKALVQPAGIPLVFYSCGVVLGSYTHKNIQA